MTTQLFKAICVWPEENRDNPKWVVSLDELDGDGYATTTNTLCIDESVDEAFYHARNEGRRRGLPVYSLPLDGPPELIQPASE